MKNEGFFDRGIRLVLASILFVLAFFWLPTAWSIVFYVLALISLVTALTGFCLLYKPFKVSTVGKGVASGKWTKLFFLLLILIILIGGSWASIFFSKKFFLEDFNAMNSHYKQTLFNTGQEKRAESIENYENLVKSYAVFEKKYSSYRPFSFRFDGGFESDLKKIESIINGAKDNVYSGDLKEAHLDFEKVRPITQELFKRNGFSMLALALVDFHDSMEKVLEEADAKNPAGVVKTYAEANDKLLIVESEANDPQIQAIRKNLEDLLKLAQEKDAEALPDKGAELKSSFVKVYLNRG